MGKFIKRFGEYERINELSEFNLQRMNPDSVQASVHVDDRSLSTDAFDKHQDKIRQAMSRIGDILKGLSGTNAYSRLRGAIALEDQGLQGLTILRISKVDNINYDAYVKIKVDGEEYWGVLKNMMSPDAEFKSEVFKDRGLVQAREWEIKIKGLVKEAIRSWLRPEPGEYELVADEATCQSADTGKQLRMKKGLVVELVRAHADRMVVKHEGEYYALTGDNYVYFNWWFAKKQQ